MVNLISSLNRFVQACGRLYICTNLQSSCWTVGGGEGCFFLVDYGVLTWKKARRTFFACFLWCNLLYLFPEKSRNLKLVLKGASKCLNFCAQKVLEFCKENVAQALYIAQFSAFALITYISFCKRTNHQAVSVYQAVLQGLMDWHQVQLETFLHLRMILMQSLEMKEVALKKTKEKNCLVTDLKSKWHFKFNTCYCVIVFVQNIIYDSDDDDD